MVKAILFDADGVVIKARERFFSERFAETQNISAEVVLPFFKNDMRGAFTGKVNLKDAVEKYLAVWNWNGTAEEFLMYWFSQESPRDEEVLAYIDSLRSSGIKCYLATDREQYWADYLVEDVDLKSHMDGFMFSYDIGYEKHESKYFEEVLRRLDCTPNEVMYWDDDQKNVDVAKGLGIDARFYTRLEELKHSIPLT
ncbi:HAD hydrolase-like protein [Patescibacteria group bacterium]|nr:HAD hydrolase-like protein [Patescibacteria group bacterium]MBU1755251.1 HAD hydrolase-like protein [Patescibacteria group bacterium]